jgi:hypothetical protein
VNPPSIPSTVPLLGQAEKAELEKLIRERLEALHRRDGGTALLDPQLRIVVTGNGVQLDHGEMRDPLSAVEVKSLFTALCYTDSGGDSMPIEAVKSLAGEALTTLAAEINRYSPPA